MILRLLLTKTDPPVAFVSPTEPLGDAEWAAYKLAMQASVYAFYDPESSSYRVALDQLYLVVDTLKAAGFTVLANERTKRAIEDSRRNVSIGMQKAESRALRVDEELRRIGLSLYGFQFAGVEFLATHASAVLADEMGLGKTVQAAVSVSEGAPMIVVCPALLKRNWEKEIKRFRPEYETFILEGRRNLLERESPTTYQAFIVNYDILPPPSDDPFPKWLGSSPEMGTYLIADECHYLKNAKAKRTVAFRALSRAVRKTGGATWGLTGTPLVSDPSDLWAVLQAFGLGPHTFVSWDRYRALMNGSQGKFGMVWGKPHAEVGPRLAKVMLRRKKADVLPDLPEKRYQEIPVAFTDAEAKAAGLEKDLGEEKLEKLLAVLMADELPSLEHFARVRELMARIKIPAMLGVVREFQQAKEKLVVFAAHRAPMQALIKEGIPVITGDTSNDERDRLVTRFQEGKIPILGGTIGAMGVGITLTAASHVLFVNREYTPSANQQAEDRVSRIGQTRGVLVMDLIADHPLDQHLVRVIKKKQMWISGSVEQAVQHG